MTSELRVDNLKGSTTGGSINVLGEGTSATTNLQQGLAKGWVQFDTGDNPPVADGSFNVASLTDDTEEIEINLTSAMNDALFSPVSSGANSTSNPSNRNLSCGCVSSSKINTEMFSTANSAATGLNHVTWHGDLA
jgi:hypothetical protein